MDSSLLTKCPHCKTLFRIHYDHLAVADGEVRCGICYKVFNAQEEGLSYSEGPGMKADETFGHTEAEPASEPQPAPPTTQLSPKEFKEVTARASKSAEKTVTEDAPSTEEIATFKIQEETIEKLLFEKAAAKKMDRPLLWGTLSLLAIFLLGLQWMWFQKDNYALTPKWRPWYQEACKVTGCNLPLYNNLTEIEIERLAVKSHAKYTNVLIVDLIMNNYGLYPQQLPSLLLNFYDINGISLAQRTFSPEDYLKGSSVVLENMPTQTPIRVSFDILDPGDKAVNYNIQLRPTL